MITFSYFTYQDDAGRWYWQRSGRFQTFDADQAFATRDQAAASAHAVANREADEHARWLAARAAPITGPRLTAPSERDRQLIALRLASPIRPLDRTSAPVDGLALFDQVRSPAML